MHPTAEKPIPAGFPNGPSIDLAQTPLPVAAFGTVRSDVNIFRADESVDPASDPFPKPGDEFYGFELAEELGRGAFGRVFLAREHRLANRPVVLKVALKANNEQLRLARLQHTNIVPIQNAFRRGPYHVVQMPYFGRQTLADVIDRVRTDTGFPNVGGEVFSTVAKLSTQRNSKASANKDDSGVISGFYPQPVEQATVGDWDFVTDARPLRDLLTGLPYPDAVLAIMRRLADGLAHAHNRGILHLDLKPQNVLFGDDGQPMLLDFNLAMDRTADKDRKRVGGTWPYMAPEVIREFAKLSDESPDERTDLYALGIIYYELLACKLPFASIRKVPDDLPAALAERERGIPSVRDINPDVPPAVESIICKLAAPNPADRYKSVDELREDLQRQQENRPLRYAADRNPFERFQKWQRRNPQFVARAIGSAAILALTVGGFFLWNVSRQNAAGRADREVAAFLADHEIARGNLAVPTDIAARRRGIETAVKWLDYYGAGRVATWTQDRAILSLEPARRTQLLETLGESALLLAHAESMESRAATGDEKAKHLDAAMKWNRVAEECYGESPVAALFEQRTAIEKLSGLDSSIASGAAVTTRDETDADRYLRAVRAIGDGNMAAAIDTLKSLTETNPGHFAAQMLLGLSYQATGQSHRAIERLQVARPLAPNDPRPGYHIGLLALYLGKAADAEKEFSAVLAKHPNHAQAYLNRGHVRRMQGKWAGAIEDYRASLERGGPAIPLYYYLGQTYELSGDKAAADRENVLGDTMPPKSPEDFSVRAHRVLKKDPAKALEYFKKAIELNPYFLSAWHNKAHVLSEKLDEWDLAIESLKQAIAIAPGFAHSRASLAVLYARTGKRDEAHREIQTALALSGDPEIVYQASSVYAVTSVKTPADRAKSLEYFRQCFREGFRKFSDVADDQDMKAMLEADDFKAVFEAAQKLIK